MRGPRFWPQVLVPPHRRAERGGPGAAQAAGGSDGSLRLVFVRKRAGQMSYEDDPTGMRSLLAQSHLGMPGAGLAPRPSAQASGVAWPWRERCEASGAAIWHLAGTFHADPSSQGLAEVLRHLCHLLALAGADGSPAERAAGLHASAAFLVGCCSALEQHLTHEHVGDALAERVELLAAQLLAAASGSAGDVHLPGTAGGSRGGSDGGPHGRSAPPSKQVCCARGERTAAVG